MTRPAPTRCGWWLAGLALVGLASPAAGQTAAAPLRAAVRHAVRHDAIDAAAIDEAARALPRLHSLLVSRRGELIVERYYNRASQSRPANIKSASKSVISTLVGIAIDRGLIAGVRTPIATYFPELARDPDVRKRQITVEDLLTMRSGLEGTSGRNYGAWVLSRNWVQHALARPMFAAPGAVMEYSTGNTHLLSAIVSKASGMSTWQFANEALVKPLGSSLSQWPRDPQGIYFGGNDMLMTPRQLIAFGELYLNKGRVGGRQVVPERWVARSCEGRRREFRPGERQRGQNNGRGAPGGAPDALDPLRRFDPGFDPTRDRQYGYGWWVHALDGYDSCFAWGYGGQYVFVLPALDLVLVTTASPDVSEERRGHRREVFDILSRLVIQPIAAARR